MSGKRNSIVIIVIVAIAVSGCVPAATNSADRSPIPSATPPPSPYNSERVAQALQESYRQGDNPGYRVLLFAVYQEMRLQDGGTITRRATELFEYATTHGADALEPLLLAYSDFVASSNDQAAKSIFFEGVRELAGTLHFESSPNYAILVPLGRVTTPISLDVRADAMRAALEELLPQIGNGLLPTIDELLGQVGTRNRLCQLPTPGMAEVHGNLAGERIRRSNCSSMKAPGGVSSSAFSGGLGPLAKTACVNPLPVESVRAAAFLRDVQACKQSLETPLPDPTGPSGRPAPPEGANPATVVAAAELGVELLARTSSATSAAYRETIRVAADLYKYNTERQDRLAREYDDAVQKQATAEAEKRIADRAAESAQKDYDKAEKAVHVATSELTKAQEAEARTRQDSSATAAQRAEAARRTQEAKTKLTNANADKETAKKKLDKAKDDKDRADANKKAADKKADRAGKAAGVKMPDDQFSSSPMDPACARVLLMGGTVDPRTYTLLTGKVDTERLREELDIIVINPAPDSPEPLQLALDFPVCGFDPATQNAPRRQCLPVDCDPNYYVTDTCSCGEPNFAISPEAITHMAASACSKVIRCADGQQPVIQGMVCSCAESPLPSSSPVTPAPPEKLLDKSDLDLYAQLTDRAAFLDQHSDRYIAASIIGTVFSPQIVPTEIRACDADVKVLSAAFCP
jgi:hypothetical protein